MSSQSRLQGHRQIHLIGIGGSGMSAIARVLLGQGYAVSGSDLRDSPLLRSLAEAGARVWVGHASGHVAGADLVAATSAAPPDNPEILEARRRGLPLWSRGEMLRHLIAGRRCLAVAGTHGKTTTTAMLALILRQAGQDPSFIIGGEVPALGTNGYAGQGPHFVLEADEYDRTFLALRPTLAVVTNVDWDHVDCYPDRASIRQAFAEFVALVPAEGAVYLCRDDPGAWGLPRPAAPVVGYGLEPGADWWAAEVVLEPHGSLFTAVREGCAVARCRLPIPGRHNVLNALAALAVTTAEGVDPMQGAAALSGFRGVERRFQYLGTAGQVLVVDDYAHHPTEVAATLQAARQRFPGRRLVVAFQPHTYSRTVAFASEFAEVLGRADRVLVTGIYAAREKNPGGVSGERIARLVSPPAAYAPTLEDALAWLLEHLEPGDVLLTLGAGDITTLGPRVLESLAGPEEESYGTL